MGIIEIIEVGIAERTLPQSADMFHLLLTYLLLLAASILHLLHMFVIHSPAQLSTCCIRAFIASTPGAAFFFRSSLFLGLPHILGHDEDFSRKRD